MFTRRSSHSAKQLREEYSEEINPAASLFGSENPVKRWNGWGDSEITFDLPASAVDFLGAVVGEGQLIPDADIDTALQRIPRSRLEKLKEARLSGIITSDSTERLRHSCGQSLPNWIALRSGQILCFPDAVAFPNNPEEIRLLIQFAHSQGIRVIPYGGGTSVVGHIDPLEGSTPVMTIDLSRLNKLIELDKTNRLATFEAGINGPAIEAQLSRHGYTLGHFPQSFEQSTLGGWIATRSAGQQSFYYGRIEDLFAGGQIETPRGSIELAAFPASAAGPDLRQVFLGSEGRLGIITTAAVRIRPCPTCENFYGFFFHEWEHGIAALRQIAQEKTNISMLRLSDADETKTTLMLSGKDRLVGIAQEGLDLLGYRAGRSLLVLGLTGDARGVRCARQRAFEIFRANGGLLTRFYSTVGAAIGKIWQHSRFTTPYLRNTLWEHGYALDTFETALNWSKFPQAAKEIKQAVQHGLEPVGERVLVFAHLSHVYRDGASLYVTYLFRRTPDPDETLANWQVLKNAASQAVIQHGGTISHQHGVGRDHAPFLQAEKGAVGIALIRSMMENLDPRQVMNPGKLIETNPDPNSQSEV